MNDEKKEYWTVRELPARLRPREELSRNGVERVSDEILMAVLLRNGTRGVNVVDLARKVLVEFGSLTALAKATVHELSEIKGMGIIKAQELKAALELAKRMSEEQEAHMPFLRTPQDVAGIMHEKVRTVDVEIFWVLLLDIKNRLKFTPVEVSRGILDASLVHAREVFRPAVRAACAAVILCHNHPSGDPTPSAEDIRITRQLIEAGKVMDIKVTDHVILGRPGNGSCEFCSMRETGVVSF